jgi:peptide chain release factor 3
MGAGAMFDRDQFLAGNVTPVFFGSALTNFGVEPFLSALLELAPPPTPRQSVHGIVAPTDTTFSGFVFKLQANLDPKHRDEIAFLRVCSGRFQKDMVVHHPRLGRKIRMSRPHRLFARDRETVEEAYPGDVVGLSNPGLLAIGDTLSTDTTRQFAAIPRFSPERFGVLHNRDVTRHKQFHKGLGQLEAEGVVQVLYDHASQRREPIVAAVGELQFDVLEARLTTEYGVDAAVERLPHVAARWVHGDPNALVRAVWPLQSIRTFDQNNHLVVLFSSEWELSYCIRQNPDLTFHAVHPQFAVV